MKIELPHNGWRPRPHQRGLWGYLEHGGKRAIEIAHRRWGKDDVALHYACIAAHERVGGYWHCLPMFNQARKAIWAAVNPHTGRRRIDEAFPHELRENTNEQEMFIRFKNGSTWQVIGSDNYDALVGASVAGVVFSEWALSNPTTWGFIAPILEENGGWALFITTPRGRNHAKSMLDMARGDDGWWAEVSSVTETKAVSDRSIEQQRKEYRSLFGEDAGDALIEQEYYCSFEAAILGAYWGREMVQADKEGRICALPYEPDLPVHTAWDIGVGDDTAIWLFQEHYNQVRIIGYYENRGYAVSHYVNYLNGLGYTYGNDYVPHDAKVREWSSEGPDGKAKSRIETMKELGRRPVPQPLQRLDDSIHAARRVLPHCIFDEGCGNGLEALRQFRREWDDKLKTFKDTPLHDWASHGASAFRTLAWAVKAGKAPVVVSDKPKPKRPFVDNRGAIAPFDPTARIKQRVRI